VLQPFNVTALGGPITGAEATGPSGLPEPPAQGQQQSQGQPAQQGGDPGGPLSPIERVRGNPAPAAGKEAGKYKGDRALFRARLEAALDLLRADPLTDPARVAVIGYCFGGTGALEVARSGAAVAGVVSFHGGLDAPEGMKAAAGKIPAKVLVLHGADDPFVSAAEIAGFQREMTAAKADWQMVYYSGAVHSFTQTEAGSDPSRGAAYHAPSDRRSWEAMKVFFSEIFR
jgi:dienelactone hydrolase